GYGYTEDFPIAKIFRESRVPRIYEGTNEINRLNFTQHLIRQMQRAGVPLVEEARAQASKLNGELPDNADATRMLHALAEQFRAATLLAFQRAWDAYGDHLRAQRQEVAAAIADMAVYLYGLDSILARLPKLHGAHAEAGALMALLFAREGALQLSEKLHLVLHALEAGEATPRIPVPRFNAVDAANRLAEHVLQRDGYPIAHA
ncbi:MAG: acyl-CoA dehydrogenase family protein, partial [Fimbriimonadales bacterium]|nr:acyl-CoA dehydrogenase family protein [Fimbriimonadales bacterium]